MSLMPVCFASLLWTSRSLSRVIVHLTGGETKRVAFEQDSTVKKVLLLLSPAVNAEDCFVWQVTKDGVGKAMVATLYGLVNTMCLHLLDA